MPILEARKLTKRFSGVVALRQVDFELEPGEIHAICGENGAGKSTLIKLLAGIHPHGTYEGELRLCRGAVPRQARDPELVERAGRRPEPVAFRSIRDAEAAGIAIITQEFALVDELSIAENLFLGRLPRRGLRVDWTALHGRAAGLLKDFGLVLSPELPVGQLGIGQKQLIEILRAIDKQSRILVLDEPTAALPAQEVTVLLEHLRRLRARGTACIYISHKLDEVFAVADRITVLRDGETVATSRAADTNVAAVIKAMVGREITELFPPRRPGLNEAGYNRNTVAGVADPGPPVLSVRDLEVSETADSPARLSGISFEVRAGEVLGFGGLMGAGRTELLLNLFGAWGHRRRGEVFLRGSALPSVDPRGAIERGIVLASEDRRRNGLVLGQDVGFNLSLSSLSRFTRAGGRLDLADEQVANQQHFDSLRIRAPGQRAIAAGLSGGNQQKVVLGKALMTKPTLVMLDEPTRGIDVGAKREIYELINRLTDDGLAVILVSSELPELMGMSDRIVMLAAGRIGGVFRREEFSQERLLAAAMGRIAA